MQTLNERNTVQWYYDGLACGEVRAIKCEACAKFTFPPTGCCAHCGSWNVKATRLSGKGTLHFATHTGPAASHPRFEKIWPLVYGHVELEEGPFLHAIVQGVAPEPEALRALYEKGLVPVEAVTMPMDDIPVIAFRLKD
jgi:uncharacterized OB-fold protein